MYDLKQLRRMSPHSEIARGSGPLPECDIPFVKWVAVRGAVDDWAIYFSADDKPYDEIRDSGAKLQNTKAIRRFIPCTDGMMRKYRW